MYLGKYLQKCKHKRRKELEINNTEKYLGEAPCHKLELYYRCKIEILMTYTMS